MKILIVGAGLLLAATAAPALANGGGASRGQHAAGNAGQGFGYLDKQFFRAWVGFAHGKHYGWFRGRHWGWFKPHNPHWPHEPPMSP